IEKHNFQPNAVARALAKQSSRVLGIVVPELVSAVFTSPFFATLIQNMTGTANEHDYDITLWLTTYHDDSRILKRILNDTLSDGLIIAEASFNEIVLDTLENQGKPYVMVGKLAERPHPYHFVDVENEH